VARSLSAGSAIEVGDVQGEFPKWPGMHRLLQARTWSASHYACSGPITAAQQDALPGYASTH